MLDIPQLVRDMDRLASRTWRRVEEGDKWGMKFREEAITDENLFQLASRHSPDLVVQKFEQTREHETGADFELWIGSDAGGWLGIRIQAKRLHHRSFPHLDHEGFLAGERQDHTLTRSSRRDGVYAMHAFYVGWSAPLGKSLWPTKAAWLACPNGNRPPACVHARIREHGVSLALTERVTATLDRNGPTGRRTYSAVRHLSNALPWSRLFDPDGRHHRAPAAMGSVPLREAQPAGEEGDLLAGMEKLFRRMGRVPPPLHGPMRRQDDNMSDDGASTLVRAQLPVYARRMLAARRGEQAAVEVLSDGADPAADAGVPPCRSIGVVWTV